MMPIDVSTGRCPNKRQGCECKKVCAMLYGENVRKLRQAAIDEKDPKKKAEKQDEWNDFQKKYASKIY